MPARKNVHKSHVAPNLLEALKPAEIWRQDESDPEMWHHASGIIVNTPALEERARFFRVIRLRVGEAIPLTPPQPSIALGL